MLLFAGGGAGGSVLARGIATSHTFPILMLSRADDRTASSAFHIVVIATGVLKRPDPNSIPRSFYGTRLDAISNRHYAVDRGALVIAADNQNGLGGKLFNTLPRQELPSFVGAIPMCHHRNLYVLVDEHAAVDPFFDIDCPLPLQWLERTRR
ncbi:putative PrimPol-like protein 2 [Trypanosoma cruzi]|uniref:Putative PrimPol-like protein 2 n=1 Tax=Trypanosoma cruzi TaxID=5693 RepID=A0A2V2V2Q3_TRYCR|nr:putative PrimPol-like protein 2 [Trypanosoma cruzi]